MYARGSDHRSGQAKHWVKTTFTRDFCSSCIHIDMEQNTNTALKEQERGEVSLPPLRSLQPNAFHAVAYANRDKDGNMGWACFALAPNSKLPLRGSHWIDEATKDKNILAEMFRPENVNVGIRTGEISKLMVVDIDCHEGGANGHESIRALAKQGFLLPMGNAKHGVGMVSTPTGGLHLYYAIPPGIKIKNSTGEIAPGIDIRGEGGYVVAPPSKTEKGEYKWKQYPVRLMTAPEWLAEAAKQTPPPPRPQYRATKPTEEIPPVVAEMLKDRLNRIASASTGQRNETLNRDAFYLAKFIGKGFSVEDLEGWLLNAAMASGMPAYEAHRTIESALRSQMQRPPGSPTMPSMHKGF